MIEINLLPEGFRKKESVRLSMPEIPIKKTLLIVSGVYFGAAVLLNAFMVTGRIQLSVAHGEIITMKERNQDILAHKKETEALKDRLGQAQAQSERKGLWSLLLNSISDSMTKGVWLTSFKMVENQEAPVKHKGLKPPASGKVRYLELQGCVIAQGQETAYIGKFIKSLKENVRLGEFFEQVELSGMNQKRIKDFDVYEVLVVCIVKGGKF